MTYEQTGIFHIVFTYARSQIRVEETGQTSFFANGCFVSVAVVTVGNQINLFDICFLWLLPVLMVCDSVD